MVAAHLIKTGGQAVMFMLRTVSAPRLLLKLLERFQATMVRPLTKVSAGNCCIGVKGGGTAAAAAAGAALMTVPSRS